jgi:hypothetical protein
VEDRRVRTDLNTDWARLVADHGDRLPGWRESPALEGCADLDAVLVAIGRAPDAALLTLLEATRAGDELAARVVLQALLPKMVRMARRDRWSGVGDYVAQLWCVVHAYPLARRRSKVAANLALDTLKQVVGDRGTAPEAWSYEGLSDAVRIHRPVVPRTEAERLLASAHDLRLIDPATGAILRTVYVEGLSSREAAVRHGGTADMVRYRCSRGVRRLAEHAVELAAA